MLFHTWIFLIFFLIVYPVYLLVRKHNAAMNLWLMLASYTFYGWWNPNYLALLFGTSAIDFLMVVLMDRSKTQQRRKLWLIISLVSNFGFLGYFKYSGFFTENINWLLDYAHAGFHLPNPVWYPNKILTLFGAPADKLFTEVVLPIGISFHTFQSMSYTIDAYKGTIQTERSFIRFLTFVSFFPQLVAGPIERAKNLLPQLQHTPKITSEDIGDGLSLFLVGFFKKVALADYLATYVDKVYGVQGELGMPAHYQAPALILATVAFAWQIYFDFSGYTDMARGLARVMGFRMMLNFNNPYVATGLGDFWNRWHISLSTWFKDYVYFPLGGSRGLKWETYRNVFITMVVSGLWHGAAWRYIVWGAIHAIGRVLTFNLERNPTYKERIPTFVKQCAVFAFVNLAWVFFRAQNMSDAWLVISRVFMSGFKTPDGKFADPQFPILMLLMIAAVWLYQMLFASGTGAAGQSRLKRLLEIPAFNVGIAVLMIVYLLVVAQPGSKAFIYFQF
ncbi:MAG TPA: MBOAT family O-acyltransferase [Planctomycetota bacterium]|nr:MBOAT family O-acyltransferase [Planctomycetota bacterium]